MKKILSLCLIVCLGVSLVCAACGGGKIDYENAEDFEAALNNGDVLTGKTVTVKVNDINPTAAIGFTFYAGEHLNFVSTDNPGIKAGDSITVKVKEVKSIFGSWIISYKKVK